MINLNNLLKWSAVTKFDVGISFSCLIAVGASYALIPPFRFHLTPLHAFIYSVSVFILFFLLIKCYRFLLLKITTHKQWNVWHLVAFSTDAAILIGVLRWILTSEISLPQLAACTLLLTSLIFISCVLSLLIRIAFFKNSSPYPPKEPKLPIPSALNEAYQSEIILITGAAGTIGSELTNRLSQVPNATLLLLDHSEWGLHTLMQRCDTSKANLVPIICDIKNKPQLELHFKTFKPTLIFHAAAYKQLPILEQFPAEALETNVIGTMNLVDCALTNQVAKFIYIATDKTVNPTSILGVTKKMGEDYVRHKLNKSNTTQWATVRFGNVWNSNGSVLPLWETQLRTRGVIEVRNRNTSRYFITVNKVAGLLMVLGGFPTLNQSYLVQMGPAVPIHELAVKLINSEQWKFIPTLTIRETSLLKGEKLHEMLLAEDETVRKSTHPYLEEISCDESQQLFTQEKLEVLVASYLTLNTDTLKNRLLTFYKSMQD